MAKRFALARYHGDGSLDRSFSFDGKVLTDYDAAPEEAITAIALDSHDRIVVAGRAWGVSPEDRQTRSHFIVARYRPDGRLDAAFNKDGKVLTPVGTGSYASASALAVDAQDRILVGGMARLAARDQFALVRYNVDGQLDASFAQDGIALTGIESARDESIESLVIDPQGRILVGGWAMLPAGLQFALARYRSDGWLDAEYGSDGIVLTDFEESIAESIEAIAIDSSGRLVAGGWATIGGNTSFALARYTSAGLLDDSFGQAGKAIVGFSSAGDEMMKALAIDSHNRIVVGGLATVDEGTRFALARFCADGSVDANFNREGRVLTDFHCSSMEGVRAIAIDSAGRIVAAGEAEQKFALARYLPDGSLDLAFGEEGKVLTAFTHASYDGVWALVIDRQGRIVVGGSAE